MAILKNDTGLVQLEKCPECHYFIMWTDFVKEDEMCKFCKERQENDDAIWENSKPPYTCGHCGKDGLPSLWTLKKKDGSACFLITECANNFRHDNKYKEDYSTMTVIEE